MEEFFRGVMIEESAIYTLWGTKPVTVIIIDYYTDEEKDAFLNQMSEEELKTAVWSTDYCVGEKWEKWDKLRERFSINRYLLFKKPHSDPKLACLYFVDILQLAATLQEHYELFKRETGMDFDPIQVVLEMEKGSKFWNEVWDKSPSNTHLIGILFGFGLKNSFCYQWKWWPSVEFEKIANTLKQKSSSGRSQGGDATIDHLLIPSFASFFNEDEVIEQYNREREKIKKIYKGHDFLDVTLRKLTES